MLFWLNTKKIWQKVIVCKFYNIAGKGADVRIEKIIMVESSKVPNRRCNHVLYRQYNINFFGGGNGKKREIA